MKSFLDRFRRKGPDDDDEPRQTESARDLAAEALKQRGQAAETPPEDAPATAAKPGSAKSEVAASAGPAPRKDETISFTLGDFLPRIPTQLLTATEHDAAMPMTFDAAELSARISRGQTTISLAEIYKRAPKIFRGEIRESDNIEIRFPWQKLLEMVRTTDAPGSQPKLTEAAAEALAQKLRARKRTPGGEPAPASEQAGSRAAAGPRQPTWFSRPTPVAAPPAEPRPAEPAPAPTPPRPTTLPTLTPAPLAMPAAAASADLDLATELERITKLAGQDSERLRKGYEETIAALEQEQAALTSELDRAREELKGAAPSTGGAGEDATTLRGEIEALRAAAEAKEREIQALHAQLDEHHLLAGTEVAAIAQERDEHRQAHDTREQELAALRAEADTRDRDLATLRERLAQVEQTAHAAVNERDTQRTTLEASTRDFEALKAEAEARAKEVAQAQASLAQLQQSTESGLGALSRERDQFRAAAEAQQNELAALQQRLAQVEQSAQTAAQERDAQRAALEASKAEGEARAKQLAQAQASVAQLQQSTESGLGALSKERDQFRTAAEARQNELATLQKHLARAEETAHAAGQERDDQRVALEASAKELEATKGEAEARAKDHAQAQASLTQFQQKTANALATLAAERDQFRATAETQQNELAALQQRLAEAGHTAQERDAHAAKLAESASEIEALYTDAARYEQQIEQEKAHFTQLQRTAEAGLAAITDERDQARGDAEARAGEIAALQKRLDQFSQAAKAELTEADAERDRLRLENDAVTKSLAAVQGELDALKQGNAAQVESLTGERDALAQQKQHFTEQIATLQKAVTSRSEVLGAEGERSQREHQRHTEEFQRRIAALETTQREVAQELSRERESRIKAERTAAQADRARGEASALVESTRNDARRELETGTRKREAEFSKSQKELQEKLDVQIEAHQKLKAERDALAKERDDIVSVRDTGIAELTALKGGHDKVSTEANALREERDGLATQLNELQLRLTAADERGNAQHQELESARQQLLTAGEQRKADGENHARELQAAREEAGDAAKLREQVSGLEKAKAGLDQDLGDLTQQRDAARKRVERLQGEIDELLAHPPVDPALVADFERIKAALAAAQQQAAAGIVETGKVRAENERLLATEREAHARELQRVRDETNLTARAQTDKLAAIEKARSGLEKDLAAASEQRDAARKEADKLKAEVEELHKRPAVDPAIAAEFERTKAQLAEAQQKITTITAELDQQRDAASARAGDLEKARAALEHDLADLTQQRNAARKRVEKLQGELDELLQRPEVDPAIGAEFERTKAQLAEAQQRIAAVTAELDQQRSTAATQANDFENAKTTIERNLADLTQQRDAARKRVEKLQAEVDDLLQRPEVDPAVAAEFERTKSQLDAAAAERDTHARDLQRLSDEAKAAAELIAQLRQRHGKAESAQASAEQDLARVTRDYEASAAEARALEERLHTAETAIAAKDADLSRVRTEQERVLAGAKAELDKTTEAIRRERDEFAAELATTRERTKSLLSSNAKEQRAALAALSEERDAARSESVAVAQRLAELRIEVDQKAAQHQRDIDGLKGQLEKLAGDLTKAQQATERQGAAFVSELKAVTEQRDKAAAAEQEVRAKTSVADESRAHAEQVARLERDVARMRRERDQLVEQRDELRDRIAGMADAQQRLAKEIGLQAAKSKPLPTDVVQKPPQVRESNVIDISEADVLRPGEPDTGGVRPPRLRPMMIPPPNLRVL